VRLRFIKILTASRQFQKGVLALSPAKALPLLLAADETAYSTSPRSRRKILLATCW
jgi:hypothetical protein